MKFDDDMGAWGVGLGRVLGLRPKTLPSSNKLACTGSGRKESFSPYLAVGSSIC